MTTSPSALPASRSTTIKVKKRRFVALALVLVLGSCLALFVLIGDHGSGSGRTLPASSPTSISTFLRHYWWGHGRLFAIHRTGRGTEQVRTYAGSPPYYAKLVFDVVSVSGTPLAADARFRVISVRNRNRYLSRARRIRVGELGTLRLRHGVITDSLTRATFCAPNVDRCGL